MEDTLNQKVLREKLICLYCEVIFPEKIIPYVFPKESVKPNPKVLKEALANTKQKIKTIIMQMPVINLRSLEVRIPGAKFLKMLLLSEYLFINSINGEKATIQNLQQIFENDDDVLKQFLHAYGFIDPNQLLPHKKIIEKYYNKDNDINENKSVFNTLMECLNNEDLNN